MSIDAKELRLGSKVDAGGYYTTINVPEMLTIADQLNPIPLSPELLLKCGFVEMGTRMFPHYEIKYTAPNVLVGYSFKIDSRAEDDWRWIEGNANVLISSLHQLQNLYFALTNTELEINL